MIAFYWCWTKLAFSIMMWHRFIWGSIYNLEINGDVYFPLLVILPLFILIVLSRTLCRRFMFLFRYGPTHSQYPVHEAKNNGSFQYQAYVTHLFFFPAVTLPHLFTWAICKQEHPGLVCMHLIFGILIENSWILNNSLFIFTPHSRRLEKKYPSYLQSLWLFCYFQFG